MTLLSWAQTLTADLKPANTGTRRSAPYSLFDFCLKILLVSCFQALSLQSQGKRTLVISLARVIRGSLATEKWKFKIKILNFVKLSKQDVMWLPLVWAIIYPASRTDLKKDMKAYEFFPPFPGCSFCLCSRSLHPRFRVNPLFVEDRRAEAKTHFNEPPSSGNFQEALPAPTPVLDLNS